MMADKDAVIEQQASLISEYRRLEESNQENGNKI